MTKSDFIKFPFILKRLKELGKTQKDFADYLGIDPGKINYTLKSGIREFQKNEIFPAADFLGLDREDFFCYLSDQTKIPKEKNKELIQLTKKEVLDTDRYSKIDIVDALACAGNGIENSPEAVIGRYLVPLDFLRTLTATAPENIKILKVSGDSMEPSIYNGDIIWVDISVKTPDGDGLFLIKIVNGLFVRRIQFNFLDGTARIVPDNPKYREITSSDGKEIAVVGKVICVNKMFV